MQRSTRIYWKRNVCWNDMCISLGKIDDHQSNFTMELR